MSSISKSEAIKLFGACKTVRQLSSCICENGHLWFDENSTQKMLKKCHKDVKKSNASRAFGTFLIDKVPYILEFEIFPNNAVQLKIDAPHV